MSNEAKVRQEYHSLVRKDVLELVPDGMNSVLDVGGGTGGSSAYLKESGKVSKAVVVDLVADNCLPAVDAAYGGNLENPELLHQVKTEQGKFDVILCLDVLEHLTDPWSIVDRLSDMLHPGGVLITSVPNARNYRLTAPLVFKGKFELTDRGLLDRTHLRWFVRSTARELVERDDLAVEYFHGHFGGRKKKLFNKLTLGLFREFLIIQFYIRSRKSVADR
ncbi:class I SAM-dependent methyltransferase [Rhodobacteraceae bacterium KMM 6894]|nr:class I SAM-dependent methyltransferase [Rhodobacteraceae bacterium KMM 6894]